MDDDAEGTSALEPTDELADDDPTLGDTKKSIDPICIP